MYDYKQFSILSVFSSRQATIPSENVIIKEIQHYYEGTMCFIFRTTKKTNGKSNFISFPAKTKQQRCIKPKKHSFIPNVNVCLCAHWFAAFAFFPSIPLIVSWITE